LIIIYNFILDFITTKVIEIYFYYFEILFIL